MGKEAAIFLFFGVFYLRVCLAASLNRSTIDESALLAFKAHINSDILAKNWSQETSFCTWIGVSCSRRHARVTGLDLFNMGLRGTIAREISNLTFLTLLDISNNSINGLIPSEIGKLRRLRVLYMAFNKLSYHIPQSLGLLRKLEDLDLSNNHLSGDIPISLSACVELNILDLSHNNLTGSIPIRFQNLSQLQELFLRSNKLTEYGSKGLVTPMVDVYSYGILLMEVLSRRKPTDEMFSGELTMKRWVSESFPNSVLQIVDDVLLKIDDESIKVRHEGCLTSTIELALHCTIDMPEERPTMKDVLARIKKIKLNLSNHNESRRQLR